MCRTSSRREGQGQQAPRRQLTASLNGSSLPSNRSVEDDLMEVWAEIENDLLKWWG